MQGKEQVAWKGRKGKGLLCVWYVLCARGRARQGVVFPFVCECGSMSGDCGRGTEDREARGCVCRDEMSWAE